jgi:putative transcriptional regulator
MHRGTYEPAFTCLTGHLLLAHPGLRDPNFRRCIILLSAHDQEGGALGVVTNRPLGRTLGAAQDSLADSPVGALPLFAGGPVSTSEVLLAAWRWEDQGRRFHMAFGVTIEAMGRLIEEHDDFDARVFLGYAGWSAGQLEAELREGAWIAAPINQDWLGGDNATCWRRAIRTVRPDLALQAEIPDDPAMN